MGTTELLEMINKLPADKKKEVEDFVSVLYSEAKQTVLSDEDSDNPAMIVKKRMQFGALKGLIKYMADDFDEPLEDFKEYM